MMLNPVIGQSKETFIEACVIHEVGFGMNPRKAMRICGEQWNKSLSESHMSVLFSSDIPSNVISEYKDNGYRVYIHGGDGFFTPTSKSFRLANSAGLSKYSVHFGKVEHIISSNNIDLYVTSDTNYNGDGVIHYINDESIKLASTSTIQERWVVHPSETEGGESCPICITLAEMGWINKGEPVEYRWGNESKIINGLPPYRRAHSQIGDGNWKVSDGLCKCSKQVRSSNVKSLSLVRVVEIPSCGHNH